MSDRTSVEDRHDHRAPDEPHVVTADTALRPDRNFGTSERFWLNLKSRYELEVERDRLAGTLDQIEPLATA